MQEEFETEVILSILTGKSFVPKGDFYKVINLARYLMDDEYINDSAMVMLKDELVRRLTTLKPELQEISYNGLVSMDYFVLQCKEKYGDKILLERPMIVKRKVK